MSSIPRTCPVPCLMYSFLKQVVNSSDNGYALGTHRRQPSKCLPYEEDIRVPLVIRGPGITPGSLDRDSTYNIADLGATILSLAGAKADYEVDGRVIPLAKNEQRGHEGDKRELAVYYGANEAQSKHHTVAEYWIYGLEEGKYGGELFTNCRKGLFGSISLTHILPVVHLNTTYRALRIVENGASWAYHVWCTGERELYNMKVNTPFLSTMLGLLMSLL